MRIRYLYCLIVLAFLAGCGKSGPQVAPVSGRITVDGKPMANVDIVFQPVGPGQASGSRTDSDGHYELGYKQGVMGALIGEHKVGMSVSSELVPHPPKFAAKFSNSELRREVKPGQNTFDFDVTTEGK